MQVQDHISVVVGTESDHAIDDASIIGPVGVPAFATKPIVLVHRQADDV